MTDAPITYDTTTPRGAHLTLTRDVHETGEWLLVLTMSDPADDRRAEVLLDATTRQWLRSVLAEPTTPPEPDPVYPPPSGPVCYRRAARLTREAETRRISTQRDAEEVRILLAAAQVWATLANAAALVSERWVGPARLDGGHDVLVTEREGWEV